MNTKALILAALALAYTEAAKSTVKVVPNETLVYGDCFLSKNL